VLLHGSETGTVTARDGSRDEVHEKNSRIHLDRLLNKYTNCKGVTNSSNFGQITGIQEKLDTTCKQNAWWYTTQGNETLLSDWQEESWQTFEETSGHVRPERVNTWPDCVTDIRRWWKPQTEAHQHIADRWRKFASFAFLHYNCERQMTQICLSTRPWFLRT
jgi:hypothetical protein